MKDSALQPWLLQIQNELSCQSHDYLIGAQNIVDTSQSRTTAWIDGHILYILYIIYELCTQNSQNKAVWKFYGICMGYLHVSIVLLFVQNELSIRCCPRINFEPWQHLWVYTPYGHYTRVVHIDECDHNMGMCLFVSVTEYSFTIVVDAVLSMNYALGSRFVVGRNRTVYPFN